MSESAGVMSRCAAKPAKPAPFFCMPAIAAAGTNFDLTTPNKSVKLIKKYRIPFSFAVSARLILIFTSLVIDYCHLISLNNVLFRVKR